MSDLPREMKPEEAHAQLNRFHVVDVRADSEFRGPLGRVHGSELLPLPEIEARAAALPRDRPLLLVCRSGKRSGMACEKLRELGAGAVVNLTGGMIAWNRAGLPLEQSDPASLQELVELIVAWFAQVGSRSPEAAAQHVHECLGAVGSSPGDPTLGPVSEILDLVEKELAGDAAPPDLDLSLQAFRRALAVL